LSNDLYEAPREEISQGDILELLPHLHLPHPLNVLETPEEGSASGTPGANLTDKKTLVVRASCRYSRAMLLTHDCEIDKTAIKNWIVCPVLPLSDLPGNIQVEVKKNKVFYMLHLPKHWNILEESALILNHPTTIDKQFVESARRIVSLSDLGRRAFYAQYIRWVSRWQLRDLSCPNCHAVFNAVDSMIVRPD
jgi:hypothetical protein